MRVGERGSKLCNSLSKQTVPTVGSDFITIAVLGALLFIISYYNVDELCSRLDFYSEEGGRRNGVTMGLAPVGGVCLPAHACVVAEFGAQDLLGRPYPSAGFTSVYILAHEIGHK